MTDTRKEDLAERLHRALEDVERLKKERDQVVGEAVLLREKYHSLRTTMQELAAELGRLRTMADRL